MIAIRLWRSGGDQGDLRVPVIVCDFCGKQVTGAGVAFYLDGDDRIRHTHKGECARLWDVTTCGEMLSEDLDTWLSQLYHNAIEADVLPEDEWEALMPEERESW